MSLTRTAGANPSAKDETKEDVQKDEPLNDRLHDVSWDCICSALTLHSLAGVHAAVAKQKQRGKEQGELGLCEARCNRGRGW